MLALRLEPMERRQAAIFDVVEPRVRLSRRTWFALGAVAVFYAGIGAVVATQRVSVQTDFEEEPGTITITPWKPPEPPPPTKKYVPPAPTPPLHPPTTTPSETPPDPLPVTFKDTPRTEPIGPVATIDTPITTPTRTEPVPDPKPDPIIRRPQWISKPSPQQLARAYPDRAARMGVGGAATLLCTVTANGSMSDCSVVDESPKSYGFGKAALESARFFKISPKTVDGRPVEGSQVRVPMIFNLE